MSCGNQNLLVDRQAGVTIPASGEDYFVRGFRRQFPMDWWGVRFTARLEVTSTTGSVALVVRYQQVDIEEQPYGDYLDLISSPVVSAGDGAVDVYTDWMEIPDDMRTSQYGVQFQTLMRGTPSKVFSVDYAILMYR